MFTCTNKFIMKVCTNVNLMIIATYIINMVTFFNILVKLKNV